MLSINTNLSSLIAQRSMKSATSLLNQAVERMSTGYKVNHAKDNAAAYSIITNMDTKINAYQVAEDNVAMGMDMATAISENLELINQHASRIRDLCEQASNGTYGEKSIKAIQTEIESRMVEIERIKSNAEFNGIKLLETKVSDEMCVTGSFIQEVEQLTEEEAIAEGYTIIKSADELQAIQNDLSGKYILMNDIDLSGYNWTPIGNSSSAFTGELNGNGFAIKNLKVGTKSFGTDHQALFNTIETATIKNLGIKDANTKAWLSCSTLASTSLNSTISNCYAEGTITCDDGGGGLVGQFFGGTIINCYTNVDIIATNSTAGGIASIMDGSGNIINCYSLGSITGGASIGGLVGAIILGNIKDCYSSALVSGASDLGALFGYIEDCTATNCYFDKEKSGMAVASTYGEDGCQGVTTAELQALIDNGALVHAKAPAIQTGSTISVTLQVGTSGDSNSQITFNLATTLAPLEITVTNSDSARASLSTLDSYLAKISDYQTNLGAVTNRLESALGEIATQYENLVSSRSTLRDADIAEVSSQYIQQQILQQASATLMATANQTPAIALQLI